MMIFFCTFAALNTLIKYEITQMSRYKHIFIASLFLLAAIHGLAQSSSNGYFSHTVARGESLYSISSMYGVSIPEIVELNPGSDKRIRTGETLRIPQKKQSSTENTPNSLRYHTIQAGETLYRITQIYNVSAAIICQANPGLSAANFRTGEVIVIPQASKDDNIITPQQEPKKEQVEEEKIPCREMHKVKRKETIFGICREYGITKEELIAANPELKKEKLKKGKFLCIPHKQTATKNNINTDKQTTSPSNQELFDKNKKKEQTLNAIQAALILPFNLDDEENKSTLMVEYYEGLLLAMDSLKQQGISINLHVYDSGDRNQSIASLLKKDELKNMHIIFGPGHSEHIKPLADFARTHQIRLVIPFTSKDNEVFTNPYVYQINTPQSYLYSQVYKHFLEMFGNYNIIFVQSDEEKEKNDFINGLKNELETHNINFQTMAMPTTDADNVATDSIQMEKVLSNEKPNIFIPTSSSNITLIKLLPYLQLAICREAEKETPRKINLFGYPEWQKYTNDHLQAFYETDTYFYSSFYTNNLLDPSIQFNKKYRYWYNKEMASTFPKYGMLGFDTAYFFLKALSKYGTNMDNKLNQTVVTPVQTGFRFERVNNWGGFINKKVFFIHMTPNHELIKLDFK